MYAVPMFFSHFLSVPHFFSAARTVHHGRNTSVRGCPRAAGPAAPTISPCACTKVGFGGHARAGRLPTLILLPWGGRIVRTGESRRVGKSDVSGLAVALFVLLLVIAVVKYFSPKKE